MDELRIIGWTDFDSEYPTRECNDADELNMMVYLLRQEIADNNYIFSGEEHQNSLTGMPVFSDGTCFRASMRCWGSIMAGVYTGPNGEELSYMDFYMSLGDASNMPDFCDIDVEPAEATQTFGWTTAEDREMLQQSLSMGMTFMTTDKVLQEICARFNKE